MLMISIHLVTRCIKMKVGPTGGNNKSTVIGISDDLDSRYIVAGKTKVAMVVL